MEYQPKHAAEQSEKKKKKGVAFIALAVGSLALTAGGVYAANSISINGDNTVEFGQGAATTTTCDTSMGSTLEQSWNQTAADFLVDAVNVSYDEGSCDGKQIYVTLLDSNGTAICGISNAQFDGTTYNLGFRKAATATCSAGDVARVAITTSN